VVVTVIGCNDMSSWPSASLVTCLSIGLTVTGTTSGRVLSLVIRTTAGTVGYMFKEGLE
jgi:hypothetical protein